MPIYEYQCTSCDYRCEKIQKISDSNLLQCPSCDEMAMKKLISQVSFRLKGGGWYETDFKQSEKKKNVVDNKPDQVESKDKPDSKQKSESTNKPAKSSGSKTEPASSD